MVKRMYWWVLSASPQTVQNTCGLPSRIIYRAILSFLPGKHHQYGTGSDLFSAKDFLWHLPCSFSYSPSLEHYSGWQNTGIIPKNFRPIHAMASLQAYGWHWSL